MSIKVSNEQLEQLLKELNFIREKNCDNQEENDIDTITELINNREYEKALRKINNILDIEVKQNIDDNKIKNDIQFHRN